MKRLYPPTYVLLSLFLMIALHFLAPVRQVVPSPYRHLGWLLILAGITVGVTTAGVFQRVGTTIRPFEESSVLVVRGLYRVTRNPIYLGMVCGLLGVGIVLGSVTPFLVIPLFAYWIDSRFIRREETMLEEKFGEEYLAYKARVRRWL